MSVKRGSVERYIQSKNLEYLLQISVNYLLVKSMFSIILLSFTNNLLSKERNICCPGVPQVKKHQVKNGCWLLDQGQKTENKVRNYKSLFQISLSVSNQKLDKHVKKKYIYKIMSIPVSIFFISIHLSNFSIDFR